MGDFYGLTLGILAVWRLSHMLAYEQGPVEIFSSVRAYLSQNRALTHVLDCFYCLSLWIALPFAFFIGDSFLETILLWLACSTGAIMLERLSQKENSLPLAEEEKQDTAESYSKPLLTPIYWEEQGDRP